MSAHFESLTEDENFPTDKSLETETHLSAVLVHRGLDKRDTLATAARFGIECTNQPCCFGHELRFVIT